ncbi:MAG: SRPBCC family protein [Cyanobacteria bacterium J06639_1]
MSDHWLEHTCQTLVPADVDVVWSLWADLTLMPRWMTWVRSVEILDEELSRWTLDARGLTFNWISRTHTVIPHQIIAWESESGLHNRGALRFYDRKAEGTIVKLSVAYSLPAWLGKLMDRLFIGQAVESNIQDSLERFSTYVREHPTADLRAVAPSSSSASL